MTNQKQRRSRNRDILKSRLYLDGLPKEWLFPTTRYRGSKRKILPWIWEGLSQVEFDSALDLFGGTSAVSLLFKRMGKKVIFNDYLKFNYFTGVALISNRKTTLSSEDIDIVNSRKKGHKYSKVIQENFKDIYYLEDENYWLDIAIQNIEMFSTKYRGEKLEEKQALAYWALGQACLIKRPFNLFHRKNLSLRTRNVHRSFGNKTSWEHNFSDLFIKFADEANQVVFDNGRNNKALNRDAFSFVESSCDLVYLDPPYFFRDQRDTDYRNMYHFLEGLVGYEDWPDNIDYDTKNHRLKSNGTNWPQTSKSKLITAYLSLIKKYSRSKLLFSHKSGSLVSDEEIAKLLKNEGKKVTKIKKSYYYALNKSNGNPKKNLEWLILGE